MNIFKASWTIARKDLRVYFRDRTGMALGFGLPIVLVVAFGFIYKMTFGSEGGMSRTTLWVADEDQTPASDAFVGQLRVSNMLRVQPDPGEAGQAREKLRSLVEDGEAHHALVIEGGFEQALEEGRLPTLTLYQDPGRELESQMISIGMMQAFLATDPEKISPLLTARALHLSGLPESFSEKVLALSTFFSSSVTSLFKEAGGEPLEQQSGDPEEESSPGRQGGSFSEVMTGLVPVEKVDVKPPERPRQLSYMLAHNIAGISIMMLMFGLVACGTLLIKERDQGTLQRLMLSSLPRESLLFGKFLFTAFIGACQLAVMFAAGAVIFQVNLLQDPVTLLVLSLTLIFSVTAFGMLIAAFARTTNQAEGSSTIIILLMSALGGAWFPVYMFDLPTAGEIATRCTLTFWAMSGFQGMLWYGKPWSDPAMLTDISVLLGFGVVASLAAVALFRRRYVGN
ncbi:MAG: ABC transporter permease [Planctomycetota bacterium]